ncbi:molybdenum cofactor guanylyltransferase [Nocardioides sediminis]|uniref:molybdenum cofactor guanylyltransferase n=1 Tax=Nocardioides sediminis TaxID=433648 RepID=UPI000D2FB7B3|nr:NTP transferase domain-containing protein [Nocardioides sediminis]
MAQDLGAGGFCGIVLAGGTAARMDGIDKAGLELGGRTLLEWSIDAFVDADEVVVVGPPTVRTARPVTFTREDPPRGGPVAGLLTGVDALLRTPTLVGVLAVDMPHVTASTMRRLREAATGGSARDGAFLVDGDGRRQLAGVLSADRLAAVRPDLEHQHGMSLRALLAPLDLADVPADGAESRDVDTWADWRDLQG